jgi:DNA-binding NarL/FixJ family response regulator
LVNPLNVMVRAADPISAVGITSYLSIRPGLRVLPPDDLARPDVTVTTALHLTPRLLAEVGRDSAISPSPIVLVADHLDGVDVLALIERHVAAVLTRATLSAPALVRAVVLAAAGHAVLSSELTGRLVARIRVLQRDVLAPNGLTTVGLSGRQIDVLRLVAEGCDTHTIATKLGYAERTVANILKAVTTRLGVRNRQQAVAHALRAGII